MESTPIAAPVLAWLLTGWVLAAAPTAEREWTSTAGTRLTAIAESLQGDRVSFATPDGRKLVVPLQKLVEEDRAFLSEHFGVQVPKEGEPRGSGTAAAQGLAHPAGQIAGPLETPEGSKYLVYLPKSLRDGRKAPLMLFTDAGGGGKKIIDLMREGSEVNAWIVACSLDSRNKRAWEKNHEDSKNCINHLLSELPIDPERVYFTGSSGGAAMAFYNAERLDHAGVFSSVGYIPGEAPKGGDYFVCGGATDYNRYPTAQSAEVLGKRSTMLRYHEGSHGKAPVWLMSEGMFWLNLRYLSAKGKGLAAERLDFEASVLRWIGRQKEDAAHRAYHAAHLMKEEFGISSENATLFEQVLDELGSEVNRRYVEGIEAIDKFGRENLAPFGGGAKMQHTTPALESAARRLAEKYTGVPQIEEIALKLGQKTGKQGK